MHYTKSVFQRTVTRHCPLALQTLLCTKGLGVVRHKAAIRGGIRGCHLTQTVVTHISHLSHFGNSCFWFFIFGAEMTICDWGNIRFLLISADYLRIIKETVACPRIVDPDHNQKLTHPKNWHCEAVSTRNLALSGTEHMTIWAPPAFLAFLWYCQSF